MLGSRLSPAGDWSAPETIGEGRMSPPTTTETAVAKSLGIMDSNGIDLSVNEFGEAVVVWHTVGGWNYNPPHSPWKFAVWANRFDPAVGWRVPVALSTDETAEAYWPRVDMDEYGRAIAVWREAAESIYERPVHLRWAALD
jgi:hypothetical protein